MKFDVEEIIENDDGTATIIFDIYVIYNIKK